MLNIVEYYGLWVQFFINSLNSEYL